MEKGKRTTTLSLIALMSASLIGCGGDDDMNDNYPEIKEPISFTVDSIGHTEKLADGSDVFLRAGNYSGGVELTSAVSLSPSMFGWGMNHPNIPLGFWWPVGNRFVHVIDRRGGPKKGEPSGGGVTFGRSEPIPGSVPLGNAVVLKGVHFGGGDGLLELFNLTDTEAMVRRHKGPAGQIPQPADFSEPQAYKAGDVIPNSQGAPVWHVVQIRTAQGELPAFVELRPEPVAQPKVP